MQVKGKAKAGQAKHQEQLRGTTLNEEGSTMGLTSHVEVELSESREAAAGE